MSEFNLKTHKEILEKAYFICRSSFPIESEGIKHDLHLDMELKTMILSLYKDVWKTHDNILDTKKVDWVFDIPKTWKDHFLEEHTGRFWTWWKKQHPPQKHTVEHHAVLEVKGHYKLPALNLGLPQDQMVANIYTTFDEQPFSFNDRPVRIHHDEDYKGGMFFGH